MSILRLSVEACVWEADDSEGSLNFFYRHKAYKDHPLTDKLHSPQEVGGDVCRRLLAFLKNGCHRFNSYRHHLRKWGWSGKDGLGLCGVLFFGHVFFVNKILRFLGLLHPIGLSIGVQEQLHFHKACVSVGEQERLVDHQLRWWFVLPHSLDNRLAMHLLLISCFFLWTKRKFFCICKDLMLKIWT